ncbi:MAG TPA: protein DA1 [Roseiflexaceae bacterium]|nr:protein DA1 [Roseiflexaceae bacterium]HMP39728.1 protein DA1 [Roseiflexaceae bacterium]
MLETDTRLQCAACGQAIGTTYFRLPGRNEAYCTRCATERPRCATCGVPLSDRSWRLHDGRILCERCNTTAIYHPEEALRLYTETTAAIVRQLGLELRVGVEFRLVDAPTLADVQQHSAVSQPADEVIFGLYYRHGRNRTIYMLYGLPKLTFRAVVAHEYAHAWQSENCPLLDNEALREGFAEWVAYRHLTYLGCRKAAARMLASPHPYRPFLEQMLKLEEISGPLGVMQHMLAAGSSGG